MKKTLAAGNESFIDMMADNRYYVDKTGSIQPLMESGSYVQLITRPRRFGKTLFMDMLREFLDVNPKNPGNTSLKAGFFKEFKVYKDAEFCSRYMGQFPVLFVSLKDFKGLSWEEAQRGLASMLWQTADSFAFLLGSPRLSDSDKTFLKNCGNWEYLQDLSNWEAAKVFLTRMVLILARHYERQVILLIDEYDVPLQKSAKGGYYKEMLAFMQAFLSLLKPGALMRVNGRQALRKTVLTGCLRVSKASIFTDVNNFDVNSVCMQGDFLSDAVGFTDEEVAAMLAYFGLEDQKEKVKAWYDGYRIGSTEIYCPWDVIRFCNDIQNPGVDPRTFRPENYWAETSSNDVIEEFLGFLSSEDADRMQVMLDGGEIELRLNEQLTYGDFRKHRSEDFWTLLLFTGYLTVISMPERGVFRLGIPNKEIRETFATRIKGYFSDENEDYSQRGNRVAEALFAGEATVVKALLSELLESYVSVRDTATRAKAENYYHGFLLGLLSSAGTVKNLASNQESGDGYADLRFTSVGADVGIVLEVKHCARIAELTAAAGEAVEQIRTKRYQQALEGYACSKIFGYGIAFCRKACVVKVVDLTAPKGF